MLERKPQFIPQQLGYIRKYCKVACKWDEFERAKV
jgi:hypothetical protein